MAGLFLNIVYPKEVGYFSIYNELIYSSFKTKGEYATFHDYFTVNRFNLEFGYLKMSNMTRIMFTAFPVNMFANLGISNGLIISKTNKKTIEEQKPEGLVIKNVPMFETTKKFESGILLGCGIGYKNLYLEYRFELGNGVSSSTIIKSSTQRNVILLGYQF